MTQDILCFQVCSNMAKFAPVLAIRERKDVNKLLFFDYFVFTVKLGSRQLYNGIFVM